MSRMLHFLVFAFLVKFSVGDSCSSQDGTSHEPGDHWRSDEGCMINVCDDDSKINSYRRRCPILQCLSHHIYTEDCCQQCRDTDGDVPQTGESENHPCKRECISGESMICLYSLQIDQFESASAACFNCPFNSTDCTLENCITADGVSRSIIVANRTMPAPAINVCIGDTIIIDISNGLPTQFFAVHCHGLTLPEAPYMDGVPFITQCPIGTASTQFQYNIRASQSGTYYWHSDVRAQKADGAVGPLIIRQPDSENAAAKLYDKDLYDHIIFLQDWNHLYSEDVEARIFFLNWTSLPTNILINARGRILEYSGDLSVYGDEETARRKLAQMPFTTFVVQQGLRYRFRIINAAAQICPLAISIDSHPLIVISTDGWDVEPLTVDSLVIQNGERYDVVLSTNQDVDNYWIRVKGLAECEDIQLQQFAILRYNNSAGGEPSASMDYDYQPINDTIILTDLRSIQPLEPNLDTDDPDYVFYIGLAYNNVSDPKRKASPDVQGPLIAQLNHISIDFPSSPLLTQPPFDDNPIICNETTLKDQGKDCTTEFCSCLYVLNVQLNSIVEVILYSDGENGPKLDHALHLHGYVVRVVSMEHYENLSREKLEEMDENGEIERNFDAPVQKDTITVFKQGYTIFRFNASNPGVWFLHCTQAYIEGGMGLFFKVGELSDLPPVPLGLPTCGNYLPK